MTGVPSASPSRWRRRAKPRESLSTGLNTSTSTELGITRIRPSRAGQFATTSRHVASEQETRASVPHPSNCSSFREQPGACSRRSKIHSSGAPWRWRSTSRAPRRRTRYLSTGPPVWACTTSKRPASSSRIAAAADVRRPRLRSKITLWAADRRSSSSGPSSPRMAIEWRKRALSAWRQMSSTRLLTPPTPAVGTIWRTLIIFPLAIADVTSAFTARRWVRGGIAVPERGKRSALARPPKARKLCADWESSAKRVQRTAAKASAERQIDHAVRRLDHRSLQLMKRCIERVNPLRAGKGGIEKLADAAPRLRAA
jgi:hypothetical protein